MTVLVLLQKNLPERWRGQTFSHQLVTTMDGGECHARRTVAVSFRHSMMRDAGSQHSGPRLGTKGLPCRDYPNARIRVGRISEAQQWLAGCLSGRVESFDALRRRDGCGDIDGVVSRRLR